MGVVVVGGGLVGMLTARELAAAGVPVRLLERGAVGRESSWAGGGILSPLYPWRYPDPVSELARWSQERYPALCEALTGTGADPEWTRSGMLMLDPGPEESAAAGNWAMRFGAVVERLQPPAVAECEPALHAIGRPALWMPEVAQVRNPRLLRALRGALEAGGVVVEEGCEVTGIDMARGRVTGVATAGGAVAADRVVVAAGAWSGRVLAELGPVPAVRPVRGQMLLFRGRPGMLTRIVLDGGRYLIPRRDGRILAGSTMEEVGFDRTTTAEAAAALLEFARSRVPALADCPVERHWAGLRPGTPAGVPYICAHPEVAGLYLNAGHFRNGVVTGPASARLLADLLLGRAPALDPTPYGLR